MGINLGTSFWLGYGVSIQVLPCTNFYPYQNRTSWCGLLADLLTGGESWKVRREKRKRLLALGQCINLKVPPQVKGRYPKVAFQYHLPYQVLGQLGGYLRLSTYSPVRSLLAYTTTLKAHRHINLGNLVNLIFSQLERERSLRFFPLLFHHPVFFPSHILTPSCPPAVLLVCKT